MISTSASKQPAPRFFVPEAVQTSAMDCGPAALKCLLEGFGIPASYGRLREACQTDVDGTSINTLEDVGQRLGLQAEQMMAPVDHLLLSSAQLLPALVVTVLPNGFHHFVVVWRTHGPFVQLMDPAIGRRWSLQHHFLNEVYRHAVPFTADGWRAWAGTAGFVDPLRQRQEQLELTASTMNQLLDAAAAVDWRGFAALDAATRMVASIVRAKGIERGKEAEQLLVELFEQTQQADAATAYIPEPFWSVRALPASGNGNGQDDGMLLMRGAVLLKVFGVNHEQGQTWDLAYANRNMHGAVAKQPPLPEDDSAVVTTPPPDPLPASPPEAGLGRGEPLPMLESDPTADDANAEASGAGSPILAAVLAEAVRPPEWEVWRALRQDALWQPTLMLTAALIAALNVTVEAALLRGLMTLVADLQLGLWRWVLAGSLVIFVLLLLALELPMAANALRMGRKLEARIRIAFLQKIPRLGDRYFHSRLISDMAQRAYGLHQLHALPDLALRILRLCAQLICTTAGIIWLYPAATPIALLAALGAVGGALLMQPLQSERDMRVRTHTGALSRFYLDALMGLMPIRTHSAERTVRREHEMLLVVWARESLALARIEAWAQSLASLMGIGFAVWIVLSYIARRGEASTVLLLLYWSLNLPALGQSLANTARQYPAIRNNLGRILEPLGAPEEEMGVEDEADGATAPKGAAEVAEQVSTRGAALQLDAVTVQAGGHIILENITLAIQPGEHVAIVGESGAGKSTLVGLLLGWHHPVNGRILVDGELLAGKRLQHLRRLTAWVDPSIQLWNRPLQENLRYGNDSGDTLAEQPIGLALSGADLYDVLERLPNGLQTRLGESGGLVSGGEGQRVRFGRALLRNHIRLAILDEPFRGLDRAKRRQLLATARQHWRGATLLCITHDIAETTEFERVLVIENGRLIEDDTPQALLARPDSRYHKLLTADENVRRQQWAAGAWRRLWLAQGRLHSADGSVAAAQSPPAEDELQQIKGIGPVWAERLHQAGIHTVADLANATPAQIKALLATRGGKAPAQLQTWIDHARHLVTGGKP
ncbi:MAG: ATP-binding cassette domain-containing protein [Caldilineaceae bacterium]